jgi:DNA-binding response OmpR family regulator
VNRKILIVDDSQDTLEVIKVFLGFSGWEVCCATTPAEAKTILHSDVFDVVILDRWFANDDGLDLCRDVRSRMPQLPVVFLSGAVLPSDLKIANEAGANAYLTKPCDLEELARVVEQLVGVTAGRPLALHA